MDHEPHNGLHASEGAQAYAEKATESVKKWRDGAWTRHRGTLLLLAVGSAILTLRGFQVHDNALHNLLNATQHKTEVSPAKVPFKTPPGAETNIRIPVKGIISPDQVHEEMNVASRGAREETAGIAVAAGTAITGAILGAKEFLGKRRKDVALAA